jgi:hypothetical protein
MILIHCCKQCFSVPHCWWRYVISSVVTNGFQDGNWDVLTLCPWFETDFFRNYKSVFKCNLVPNVGKNMADMINIKQMYIYSLFCLAYVLKEGKFFLILRVPRGNFFSAGKLIYWLGAVMSAWLWIWHESTRVGVRLAGLRTDWARLSARAYRRRWC